MRNVKFVPGRELYLSRRRMIMVTRFRKRRSTVTAIQWKPEKMLVHDVLEEFGGLEGMNSSKVERKKDCLVIYFEDGDTHIRAFNGDWIVKDEFGDMQILSDNLFQYKYVEVEE